MITRKDMEAIARIISDATIDISPSNDIREAIIDKVSLVEGLKVLLANEDAIFQSQLFWDECFPECDNIAN